MNSIEEQGFEIIPNIFGKSTVRDISGIVGDSSHRRGRAGIRNALQIEAVRLLAREGALMQLVRPVLGANAHCFRATLFDKSVDSNWLVVWHQDTALPVRERKESPGWGPWSVKQGITCAHAPASALEQVLAIRVHLDDSGSENGPLRVLPTTHRQGVLSDDAIHDLTTRVGAVDCCVSSGGVLLMRPLLVHASSKVSANARPRRVLHIEYSSCLSFLGGIELAVCE